MDYLIGKFIPYIAVVLLTALFMSSLGKEAKQRAVERAYTNCENRCDCGTTDPRKRRWWFWYTPDKTTIWEELLFGCEPPNPLGTMKVDPRPLPESLNPYPDRVPILAPAPEDQNGETQTKTYLR